MAGKHRGADAESAQIGPNYVPGSKIDRAFAEGSDQYPFTVNPHPAGTPEAIAWDAGAAATQDYETAPDDNPGGVGSGDNLLLDGDEDLLLDGDELLLLD